MSIKQFFRNLKIGARINFYMAIILLFVLIFMVFLYGYQKKSILNDAGIEIGNDLTDLTFLFNVVENQTGGGFNMEDYKIIKPIFSLKKYYDTGFPSLISNSGIYLIHPVSEGKKYANEEILKKIVISFGKEEGKNFIEYTGKQKQASCIYYKYYKPYDAYIIVEVPEKELFKDIVDLRNLAILGLILAIFVFFFGVYLILRPIIRAINNIVFNVGEMAHGKLVEKLSYHNNDEISNIVNSLNVYIEGVTKTAKFSNEIGKGNLDAVFTPLSEHDVLGNSLLEMRKSLKHAKNEEEERKIEVEKQNWATQGLAKFADILRQDNDNIEKLAFNIMSNLISYLGANQGAIFILNDNDPKDIYYELTSAIAYDRKKLMKRKVRKGEELVGRSIHEKLTIYLKEIPEDYIHITSGMGTSNPRCLLLVPLLLNDEVYGVIEMASFNNIEKHQIEFVEKLGENIASTISSVRINHQTAKLLEQSQQQSEELAAQEEEMRQNLEELMATQEEAGRKKEEMDSLWDAIRSNNLVIVFDMDEIIMEANNRTSEILGIPKDKLIGKRSSDLGMEHWKNIEEYNSFWADLKSGLSKKRTINVNTTHQGSITLAQTFTPIIDKEGNPVKVLNIGIVV
ncbi:MAG: GAF domain-containing protein [Chlorobi bacterium]|nr:GAF domain-containing protein [Chlorobiota bacterium]